MISLITTGPTRGAALGAPAPRRNSVRSFGVSTPRTAEGDEVDAGAGRVAAEGDSVGGGAEPDAGAAPGEVAGGIRGGEIGGVAASGVKAKGDDRAIATVELVFVEHQETARRQDRAVGDAELARFTGLIAQEPASEVYREEGGIEQLERVLEGRIGVGQDLVDEHRVEWQIITLAWRRRGWEIGDLVGPVRQAPLGHAPGLQAKADAIDQA